MKKQIIKLTEKDLHKIIENSVKRIIKESSSNQISEIAYRNDYSNQKAYDFDRSSDIQEVKGDIGEFIENKVSEYNLTKEELINILNTVMRYFSNKNF